MSSDISERRICRFGLYEADLDAGTLKRHGIPIRLQEQPFRILSFLLEKPGEIITRDELRARLWSQGTFVEFDGSLNTALMKLRAVLNDDPENPRFVETVPKKGYRFIAPVQFQDAQVHPVSVEAVPLPVVAPDTLPTVAEKPEDGSLLESGKRQRIAAKLWLVPLAAVVAAAVVAWAYWPVAQPRVVRVTQLTHSGRVAPGSQVVSDGTRLYFVSREGGQRALMATSIYGGSVEKLASPFENTTIFDLSPDRTQLLIGPFQYQGEQIALWIWPAHGGVPHRLGEVTANDAAWSPAGNLIAYTQDNGLFVVRSDGSSSRELQKFAGQPHSPVWAGDGSKVRFTLSDANKSTDELWEIRADGTGLRRIFPANTHQTHDATGAWNNNQRYFLFITGADTRLDEVLDSASNVWATRESWSFTAGKRQPIQLTEGPISFRSLAGAGDSDRFFALGSHPEFQLMRIDTRSSRTNVVLPDAGASDVDVTPDGEWLVYSLRESGALWKSRRNGKERIELTPASPGALAPQWSPDEKEILFTAFFLDKRPQLYVVPSEGGTPRALVPDNAGSSRSGDWSSDGRRILFDYVEGERSEVRILQRETGKLETLPNSENLTQPRWSPDGKRIAAINSRTGDILVYTLDSQKWSIVAEATSAQGMRWSADSNSVYYQETADPEQSVFRVRLGRALPEKVFGFGDFLGSMASQCRFTGVAPDGSIYATVDRGGTDIYALDVRFP